MNDINLDQTPPAKVPSPSKWWQTNTAMVATAALAAVAFAGLVKHEEPEIVAPGSTYTTNENVEYLEFAGTARNDGSGWAILDNATHEPDGVMSVSNVVSTSIRINHPGCSQVVSVIVGADNEYAQDFGANLGASAGLAYFVVEGSVNDSSDTGTADDIWNPLTDWTTGTNIWFMGKCLPA